MTTEQLITNYTPVGDIITISTCIILLFVIAKVLYFSKNKRFTFLKRALHFIAIGASCNVGYYHVILYFGYVPWAIFLLRIVYHVCFLFCLYCFILYMKHMLAVDGAWVISVTHVTRIIFAICLALDVLTPITKMGLHLHSDGTWGDSLISPYNFFYVYTLVLLGGMLVCYSRRMIRFVRICLIATETVIILIMGYQIYLNTNTYSGFTYLLPILVVLITLHSNPFNVKTGSMGKNSFNSFLKDTSRNGQSVDYLVLKLYLSATDQIPDELGKVLNSFWHGTFRDALLFELTSDLYVLAIPRCEKNGNAKLKINDLISVLFPYYYEQYRLTYKILELYNIDFLNSADDMMGALTYLMQSMDDNSVYVLNEKDREKIEFFKFLSEQLSDIEMKNDMDDSRVVVYCQPIRNMQTGRYDTAEALMRLSFPEYNLVMPNQFIGFAEEYNRIHVLTRIMINKVCRQIKQMEEEGYSFERISINFGISEIKINGFCDDLLKIIQEYGINPAKIGIELTESQNEKDFDIINNTMKTLREAGMTIYLDDVGTGYSNLDRIVQYDVDIVKFDRFFLLEAEKNKKVIKMLNHLSVAFKDMDYKLLYEGVETDAHEAICIKCGAEYIQGFKYSKPVPIEELRDFFDCEDI